MLTTDPLKHPATTRDVAKVVAVLLRFTGIYLTFECVTQYQPFPMECQDYFLFTLFIYNGYSDQRMAIKIKHRDEIILAVLRLPECSSAIATSQRFFVVSPWYSPKL